MAMRTQTEMLREVRRLRRRAHRQNIMAKAGEAATMAAFMTAAIFLTLAAIDAAFTYWR